MDFDHYSVALLILRPDAPQLDDQEARDLQDAHMSHLAELHEAGHLVVAGPLLGGQDEPFRGLAVLNVPPERARELTERDPAVKAGRFSVKVVPWMVPAGAMSFSSARFPRSMTEVSPTALRSPRRCSSEQTAPTPRSGGNCCHTPKSTPCTGRSTV
ncbi:YciI family protein [Microbispora sp. H10670]|uniref:YciI family protein n=1 Tax=Microbispora sp. H10670 TaxID=2729108 RepID=UPI001C720574|nr:YciI family protein [Microbispora sp. H10670]